MNKNTFPSLGPATTTTIDLSIIRGQLDEIEGALILAYRTTSDHTVQEIADAIDTLLAVKKSFGMSSSASPVRERQSAVLPPVRIPEVL